MKYINLFNNKVFFISWIIGYSIPGEITNKIKDIFLILKNYGELEYFLYNCLFFMICLIKI